VDGSSSPPPEKFDQVQLQTPLGPHKAKRTTDNQRRRRRWLAMLAAAVLVVGGGYGVYWFLVGRFYETTNDAYLSADNVTVAPKVSGYVVELKVGDNQPVKQGDVLARIGPRDYRTANDTAAADLQNAEANAANIDALLTEQRSAIAQAEATVDADQVAIAFATQEVQRYGTLARTGVGNTQRNQQAEADLAQKKAALERDLGASVGIAMLSTMVQMREEIHFSAIAEALTRNSLKVQDRLQALSGFFASKGVALDVAAQPRRARPAGTLECVGDGLCR
jgi:membrane fusion protein (multidrug efflux system)